MDSRLQHSGGNASDRFADLVELLSKRNPDREINIVAHSMGCLVVMSALRKGMAAKANIKHYSVSGNMQVFLINERLP
jgi:esterase/lipase superfamily enzyme